MSSTTERPATREELLAEIERLLAAADGWEKLYREGKTDIERLREQAKSAERVCDNYARENQQFHDEIERLEELLRGVGANRYWEGRFRDERAEVERLQALFAEKRNAVTHWKTQLNEALAEIERAGVSPGMKVSAITTT